LQLYGESVSSIDVYHLIIVRLITNKIEWKYRWYGSTANSGIIAMQYFSFHFLVPLTPLAHSVLFPGTNCSSFYKQQRALSSW